MKGDGRETVIGERSGGDRREKEVEGLKGK